MSDHMKTRDDSPNVWAALEELDVADFGQLSPAEQSLVLMRAAQIQQTERRSIVLAGDYWEHRFLVDVLDECLSEYIAKQCPKR
jgi:hypothetical protein